MDHIAATAKRRSADAAQEKISVDRWQRLSGADLAPDPKTVALARSSLIHLVEQLWHGVD
jgi:hypothetical protein